MVQLTMGIDTGGTYTDGVLFDPHSRRVLHAEKVLTSHTDLTGCIFTIIDRLLHALASVEDAQLSLVSLSTTLATNAIAEGKRKPAALLLLGYDPELVARFHFGEHFGTPHYFFVKGRHDLNGVEQEQLDEATIREIVLSIQGEVDAFAVVSYAGARNPAHEQRAAAIIADHCSHPVVQGHHLSQALDSIRRATTASLNASLLANTQAFIRAVEDMLHAHGVECPVMIVRGDGSVAKAAYIRQRPVEIIHSGPATSAIGGLFLAGIGNGLVIDIGGTTTDIALVENGVVQSGDAMATVGPYHTAVRTIRARSIGLGGDSAVRFDRHHRVSIGPERVLPLSRLCTEFPVMKQRLLQWLKEKDQVYHYGRLECWILRKPSPGLAVNARAAKTVEMLKDGPCLLPDLLKRAGAVSPVQLGVHQLVNHEIIERAGLTPTDLLHASGDFCAWDAAIAAAYLEKSAALLGVSPASFMARIWNEITERIAAEIVEFLSGKALSESGAISRHDGLDRWLFEESIRPVNRHLSSRIALRDPIVGIGAPAKHFLTGAASLLGTYVIFPDHYPVANAIGTVVGNVISRQEGEVVPLLEGSNISGYVARGPGFHAEFEEMPPAVAYLRQHLEDGVTAEARAAGAFQPLVDSEQISVLDGLVIRISAWAVGKSLQ
ncbi:MAG: hydantoinase/oxoprolinase family protein [Anaerolineae bacterium]|nr:hydantoinase/oxoprolinase family protein [Anaerolineae bacterium]